jgi:hypothetical protein
VVKLSVVESTGSRLGEWHASTLTAVGELCCDPGWVSSRLQCTLCCVNFFLALDGVVKLLYPDPDMPQYHQYFVEMAEGNVLVIPAGGPFQLDRSLNQYVWSLFYIKVLIVQLSYRPPVQALCLLLCTSSVSNPPPPTYGRGKCGSRSLDNLWRVTGSLMMKM